MRRVFATLFLIPLLAMISSASACDLSCSLEQFHSICKLHVTDNSGRQLGSSSSSETAMDHDMDMPGGGSPTVSFVGDTLSASNCANQFVITRTYRATDACGNLLLRQD